MGIGLEECVSDSINRRNLLRGTAAGLLAPLAARAAEPRPIRTGILGTRHGHLGGKLQAMKDSPDYEVAGVCEPVAAAYKSCSRTSALSRSGASLCVSAAIN